MTYKISIVFALFMSISILNKLNAQEKTKALSSFIEKKRNYNKHSRNGFSIVLYNGHEKKALEVYKQFKKDFKTTPMKLTYVSPDWKVLTPAYNSKLEAEKVYLLIKEDYPNAKIL